MTDDPAPNMNNTNVLTACSWGHDWQSVTRAMTGWSVLVVCRRCAASEWVGAKEPIVADGTKGMERGR